MLFKCQQGLVTISDINLKQGVIVYFLLLISVPIKNCSVADYEQRLYIWVQIIKNTFQK